jgi:hypothetical protein
MHLSFFLQRRLDPGKLCYTSANLGHYYISAYESKRRL